MTKNIKYILGRETEDSCLAYNLDVKFHYTPGDRGFTSGRAEDCYPPEPPVIEDIDVTLDGGTFTLSDTEMEDLIEYLWEYLEDDCEIEDEDCEDDGK